MTINQVPNITININQQDYFYFGGTAYLGLPANIEFQNILFESIKKWGTAFGGSRNANVKLNIYEDCENFLAQKTGFQASLTLTSGMLAGKLTLEVLSEEKNVFYTFNNVHKAILPNKSQPFFIDDLINPKLLNNTPENIVIVADAVPTFSVLQSDFSVLKQISSSKKITLLIDESHSFGILGKDCCGITSEINLPNVERKIMVSSLGKAYGLTGGLICSDTDFIDKLKQNATFLSAAGMNPAFAQTILFAEDLIIKQQQLLQQNLSYFDSLLQNQENYVYNPKYPLIYPKQDQFYENLLKNNIIITNFNYANGSKTVCRIVITANHIQEDLLYLSQIVNKS